MVPIGSIATVGFTTGPDRVSHYNVYLAADINGQAAPGYSSGQATAAMERVLRRHAAERVRLRMDGSHLSAEVRRPISRCLVFALCVLLVFLILAAQYESWALPLAIILIVPMCLLSAMLGVWLHRLRQQHPDADRLHRAGRACLQERDPDRRVRARARRSAAWASIEAAIEACRLRLRPILMTSFAFIMGVMPLVIASGAGSEMRQAMGIAVFSGMLGVTLFGLFLTPVFFVTIELALRRKRAAACAGCDARGADVRRPCAIMLILAALAGCAVGPSYREPTQSVPAVRQRIAAGNRRGEVIAQFWTLLNDPVLDRLVERCAGCKQGSRASRGQPAGIACRPRLTGFDAYPTVTAGGFYTRARGAADQLPGATRAERKFDTYDVGFDAAWELDFFGRVRRSKEAARADVGSAEATLRDASSA